MDLAQRARIYSPFAAVRGHSEKNHEEEMKLYRIMRLKLTDEDAERLAAAISDIKKDMEITVVYFRTNSDEPTFGDYAELSGKVVEVNAVFGYLKIKTERGNALTKPENTVISFRKIADIRPVSFV